MTGFPPDNSFRPRRWLRGPHFQTILSSLPPRRSRVERRAIPVRAASVERLIECGDGVTLQAFHASPAKRGREPGKRLAVLLHGWEGSADSTYVLSMSQTLFALGFEVVRLNLRDHGATHHLNRELFHSCRLPEVVGAVRTLAQQFAGLPMVLAGFSLGGNFMLRVAAHREARDLPIERVIAVSPVLDPAVTMNTLEHGPRAVSLLFRAQVEPVARKEAAGLAGRLRLRRAAADSQPARDDPTARAPAHRISEHGGLPCRLRHHGRSSDNLAAPATVLTSLDDPIIDAADLARLARSPRLEIVTTAHGGHCGFLENLGDSNWIDAQAVKLLSRNPDS